jgi:hypothetical protein
MSDVSSELNDSLSRVIRSFADRPTLLPAVFVLGLVCFMSVRTHSAWVYFIPPLVAPLLASIVLIVEPFNPYRNFFARLEGRDIAASETDPSALRLRALLASKKAQSIILRTGILLAFLSCAAMGLIALFQHRPFDSHSELWNLPLNMLCSVCGFAVGSAYVITHVLLRWAFKEYSCVGSSEAKS